MKVENILSSERKKSKSGIIKVTTCGNIIETMEMEKVNRQGSQILNLGGDAYCLKSDIDFTTGEIPEEAIKFFERSENRGDNYAGLRRSMKAVRDLINCNVTSPANTRWLTLTYAENMTDAKQLCTDRQKFWQKVVYWHKKQSLPVPEYICIVEPQARGAWHTHELWLYPSTAPFLPNAVIADLWGHGFVKVKKLEDVDNVGAYVTAYLCDVPLDEAQAEGMDIGGMELKDAEITAEDGTKQTKKYVKGARLHLYPSGMNFYRTSRGVKRPEVEWCLGDMAKEKVRGATLTFSKTIRLTDDDYTNDIHYEYYNTVRGKMQE